MMKLEFTILTFAYFDAIGRIRVSLAALFRCTIDNISLGLMHFTLTETSGWIIVPRAIPTRCATGKRVNINRVRTLNVTLLVSIKANANRAITLALREVSWNWVINKAELLQKISERKTHSPWVEYTWNEVSVSEKIWDETNRSISSSNIIGRWHTVSTVSPQILAAPRWVGRWSFRWLRTRRFGWRFWWHWAWAFWGFWWGLEIGSGNVIRTIHCFANISSYGKCYYPLRGTAQKYSPD